MAKGILKVKAKASGGKTKVKMMAKHIMESGQRKDKKTGELIPALFLQNIKVQLADKTVFEANLGPAISKNPYLSFSFEGGPRVMKWSLLGWKIPERPRQKQRKSNDEAA